MPYWLFNTQFQFLIQVWLTYELFNKMKIVKKQNIHPMTNQPQNNSTSVMPKENK